MLAGKSRDVTLIKPEQVSAVDAFDAVVLGSGVHTGQWMKPARQLAGRSAAALPGEAPVLVPPGSVRDRLTVI